MKLKMPTPEWIAISEQLPAHQQQVLVFENSDRVGDAPAEDALRIATYQAGGMGFYYQVPLAPGNTRFPALNVTHWMPAPAPPTR
ncbi:DUF551 domain-containing protein [Hymenobacter sp. HMF4947]|uniref:DUF551 domain-containing protein n=1 Tax=Hymenobacter ginkgonis TaxID=2682976 RepID=A0A7K1TF54_9BACT|nr:DUF551 domain-containing protein [Hymenobacter ginkgonis]MVN77043.1 DUF551 domain-containing protein [Hymenobacter ginkgonis]